MLSVAWRRPRGTPAWGGDTGQGLLISPGWVLLDGEGSLHVDGVALVFEHAVA